jgi:hypothetical protein
MVIGGIALLGQGFVQPDEWWIPGLITIACGVFLLVVLARHLKRSTQEELLADHLFLLVGAFIVYFVVGALLIPFGPREQVDFALSYYWVEAPVAMRVTGVNCIGLGIALISASVVGRRQVASLARTVVRSTQLVPQNWVVLGFLIVGLGSSLYVLRFDTGQRPDEFAPGIMRLLSYLLLVVVMVTAAQGGRWSMAVAVFLTVFQAIVGLVLLTKTGVLLPMMAFFAGLAWRLGVRRVVIPGVGALLGAFLLIGDPIIAARNIYGISDWVEVDWKERLAFLPKAALRASDVLLEGNYQAWSRFCYLPPQAAGLEFYDAGDGGEDYRLLGWSLLPRFLFPDKPLMTASPAEFNTKITGGVGSSTGQGVFVDGYYNLGWLGVFIVSVAVGCFLAWTSVFAAEVIRDRALLWLPMAFVGSYMAFRIDGSFLIDYWGLFVMFVYALVAGGAWHKLLPHGSRIR